MSASGFQLSMGKSLKSNASLLIEASMFARLKDINNRSDQKYIHKPMPKAALALLRREERYRLKVNLYKRRIIGVLVIIPISIILLVVVYLLAQSLM